MNFLDEKNVFHLVVSFVFLKIRIHDLITVPSYLQSYVDQLSKRSRIASIVQTTNKNF